jgi:hypothetical protein
MPIGATRRPSCKAVLAGGPLGVERMRSAFVSRTSASGAIDAFSRRSLCPTSHPFTGRFERKQGVEVELFRVAAGNDRALRIAVVR